MHKELPPRMILQHHQLHIQQQQQQQQQQHPLPQQREQQQRKKPQEPKQQEEHPVSDYDPYINNDDDDDDYTDESSEEQAPSYPPQSSLYYQATSNGNSNSHFTQRAHSGADQSRSQSRSGMVQAIGNINSGPISSSPPLHTSLRQQEGGRRDLWDKKGHRPREEAKRAGFRRWKVKIIIFARRRRRKKQKGVDTFFGPFPFLSLSAICSHPFFFFFFTYYLSLVSQWMLVLVRMRFDSRYIKRAIPSPKTLHPSTPIPPPLSLFPLCLFCCYHANPSSKPYLLFGLCVSLGKKLA
jgi:hypothetical protein